MAVIQAFYFTKSYRTDWGNCNATPGDAIRCEAIVTFSGAEIGKRYWVNWFIRQPNNQDMAPYSEYAIAEPTTTFYMKNSISDLVSGTYTILRVELSQG